MAAADRRQERQAILDALGLTPETVTPPMGYAIDRLVEADQVARTLIDWLEQNGGPITTKGRARSALLIWSKVADRCVRFAQVVGLERRQRDISQMTAVEYQSFVDQQEIRHHDEHSPADTTTDETGEPDEITHRPGSDTDTDH